MTRVSSTRSNRLARAVKDAGTVVVGVFETALLRFVDGPAGVHEIAAWRLGRSADFPLGPQQFARLRAEAETAVAARDVATLGAIYADVAVRLPGVDTERMLHEELAVERAVCVANDDVRVWCDRLRRGGKRVVLTARTPLPHAFVRELLDAAGYAADIDVRVMPTAVALDGLDGAIVVLGAHDIAPRDLARPRVRSFAYEPHRPRERDARPASAIGERIVSRSAAIAAARSGRDERMFATLGYGLAGPLFLGLTQWLAAHVRDRRPDIVFFCARDGVFVHRVYDALARYEPLPPARYLEVSRRALVFPSLEALDEPALAFLSDNTSPVQVSEIFLRIGLDPERFRAELAAVGMDPQSWMFSDDERVRVRSALLAASDTVLARAREERPLLVSYLRASGAFDAAEIAFFDIGWGGTMQRALAKALRAEGHAPRIRGYYLATDYRARSFDSRDGTLEGWFSNASEPASRQHVIEAAFWFLEIVFSAQHGTVLGYERSADGDVRARRHGFDATSPNARANRLMQTYAMEFIERWMRIFDGPGPMVAMDDAFARFRRFVHHPSNDEARFFGDLVHVGGLGSTSDDLPIAKPPGLRESVKQPMSFLRAYRRSFWQVGYVQRVTRSNAAARAAIWMWNRIRPPKETTAERERRLAESVRRSTRPLTRQS